MGTNARVPEAISRAVSEELRVIRARRAKESVREFAERCGMPYSTLHKTLAGERMIDVEELHKIARALGTTASAVMATVEAGLGRDDLAAKRAGRGPARVKKTAARKDKGPDA